MLIFVSAFSLEKSSGVSHSISICVSLTEEKNSCSSAFRTEIRLYSSYSYSSRSRPTLHQHATQ